MTGMTGISSISTNPSTNGSIISNSNTSLHAHTLNRKGLMNPNQPNNHINNDPRIVYSSTG